jgi:OHCU decarboxylase
MRLTDLNALPDAAAERELIRCCGSSRWARAMAAARPYHTIEAVHATADKIADLLLPSDWLEAFAAHPRIGGQERREGQEGQEATWSQQEQAAVASADDSIRDRLRAANAKYEARFGYIFIVCATGKSALQMLTMLEERLAHAPADELLIAAEEQRKITQLRLTKLVDDAVPA